MRLAGSFKDESAARNFLNFLLKNAVEAKLEKEEKGGFEIWVYKEDELEKAKKLLAGYKSNPEDVIYDSPKQEEDKTEKLPQPTLKRQRQKLPQLKEEGLKSAYSIYATAVFTKLFITVCIVIFLVSGYQKGVLLKQRGGVDTFFPIVTPIESVLLYSYPKAFSLMMEFNQNYKITSEEEISSLSESGKDLLKQIEEAPVWTGFYELLLRWAKGQEVNGNPMFSSIRSGEVWRLITPIFLHAGILHILFNMLWLWLLGKMIEVNMGKVKLLLFVMITAIVTNTLQYLATGPLFMGFSGVISAMAGYVFVRKKVAPWEIYLIDNSTLIFLWIFIFGLLVLQIIAFFLQIFHIVSFQMRIANTAHVSGLLLGCLLARVKLFTRTI